MKRRFSALLLDLDGTLVEHEDRIRPRTLERLRALPARGVLPMITTGRSETGARGIVSELGFETLTVVYNGAGVWDPLRDRMVEERVLSNRTGRRSLELALEGGYLPMVMRQGEKYVLAPRTPAERAALLGFPVEHVPEWGHLPLEFTIRVTLFSDQHTDSEAFAEQFERELKQPTYLTHFPLSVLAPHRESPLQVLDIHPPCRGKAEALRLLQEEYGIAPEEVVAVGDATNDIPMFEAAGLAVAMENAMPQAKAAADRVIGPVDSDALADLIDELFP